MLLPNAESAVIDIRKLAAYALDPLSPRGQHKARVFRSVLGLEAKQGEDLRRLIAAAVLIDECRVGERDFYGQRYSVDCNIEFKARSAVVRTGWIVRRDENFPRLTSCYVLKEKA